MTLTSCTALLVLAAALPLAAESPRPVRDWVRNPAVVQFDSSADIFAIGDVHGDAERLARLLSAAGIVDRNARWTAGNALLVFTGDLIDKGPKGPAVLSLLCALRDQAALVGGAVIVLMGNHEADFLRNPGSEKAKEFALQLKNAGLDPTAIAACQGDLGAFLCGMPFAARVNDWFFSHAGNAGGRTLAQLTSDLQGGVDRDGFDSLQLTNPNSLIQARVGEQGPGGKSWFENGAPLDTQAESLGVRHIVQGHQHNVVRFPDGKTRKLGELYQWRGRLFLIDTGMSRDIDDSSGALLHIHHGAADAVCPDGRATLLWNPAAKPSVSKGVRCGR